MKQKLERAWAFGRHIPPSKLIRRAELSVRRRVSDWKGPKLLVLPDASIRENLPPPIFSKRVAGNPRFEDGRFTLTFLGHTETMALDKIDWKTRGPSQSRQLWRMNFHYMEYLEALETSVVEFLINDWINENEILAPGAWRDAWNAYALSVRIVVWIQQLAIRSRIAGDVREKIAQSLSRQLTYLAANLETDIGGNHLIKNIKALLWGAAVFEGQASGEWSKVGRLLLEQQLREQILPDGVHYERSPSYHCQVFADLLECRSVLHPPMPELDQTLEAMAQVVSDLAHEDGKPALFNDSGLNMCYSPCACLRAYNELFGKSVRPRSSFSYPEAGYFGYKKGGLSLISDCGQLAPNDLPAHGHGDILSFELSVGQQRVVVDQGVFEYVPGQRRGKSRSAAAHNTLVVNGQDQADFFGAFRFGRRPRKIQADWQVIGNEAILEGEHDGYAPMVHKRKFNLSPNNVVITDRVESPFDIPVPATLSLLMHPDIQIENSGQILRLPDGSIVRLFSDSARSVQPDVWWPDMGHELKTKRLLFTVDDARLDHKLALTLETL